ncbi:peptidoglycan-binding protein LysM [Pseudomonas sp. 681]|uniref:Peptidoglycan-binding protein LysM n=1 Tax=Pseudomonas fungipugnans TaxID=3024217 RepID=A0ABT6QUG8_9PSED|nr:FimV/HubP family polar landmark protein [Pseudomonas sp. 681]MDI2594481.1 peptidoglycan-binding protein LysM [Pseudomonas sp. 681]
MLESWQVVLRCCTRWLLVGGAFTYSALAPALGLGDITPHSALNQPFSADIALVDAAGLGEGDLSVSLASADEFSRAGVERLFFLNNLKFTPILRGNRQMIRVTSSKPVTEPFLNFLVQLNQPNGRLLREYTVLIDPPGSPGIVPATDEPTARSDLSPFPAVEPATASSPNPQGKRDASAPAANAAPSATAAVNDEVAEQLAASVLQNQQLQKTIDDLNARLLARDAQIADGKKQVGELQTRLAELQQPPAAPVVVAPAPIVVEPQESSNWLLITGLLALALLALGWLFVRWRQQGLAPSEAPPVSASRHEPVLDQPPAPPGVVRSIPLQRDDSPAGDVLEGVGIYLAYGRFSEAAGLLREALTKEPQRTDLALQLLDVLGKQGDVSAYEAQENSLRVAGFDPQQLHDIRNRYPKMESAAPPVAAVPPVIVASAETPTSGADEFQLNLDELSMDSSWDLVSPTQETASTPKPVFTSSLHVLPEASDEPDLEWLDDPQAPMLDDAFLDEFSEPNQPLAPEPHKPDNAGKLEQAQTCIDDGDLDSAIELLNQLLKEGDEPLKQTARNLLAGIR